VTTRIVVCTLFAPTQHVYVVLRQLLGLDLREVDHLNGNVVEVNFVVSRSGSMRLTLLMRALWLFVARGDSEGVHL